MIEDPVPGQIVIQIVPMHIFLMSFVIFSRNFCGCFHILQGIPEWAAWRKKLHGPGNLSLQTHSHRVPAQCMVHCDHCGMQRNS